MKTKVSLYSILVLFFLYIIVLNGCKKEDNLVQIKKTDTEVTVKNGVLCFADIQSLHTIRQKLNNMTETEIDTWEKNLNFQSVSSAQHKAFDIITANLDNEFAQLHTTEAKFVKRYKRGLVNDLPKQAQHIINEYHLQVIINNDGSRELRPGEIASVNYRILNKNYCYAIADTLHIFKNGFENITTNWKLAIQPNLKSTKDIVLRNKIIAISDYKSIAKDYRKISGQLFASRSIYWSDYELDPWSVTRLYFMFDARTKHHWWWGYNHVAIQGSGHYSMASNYRGNTDPFVDYSDGIVNTITQSPYFLLQWWQFDGDFPWIAFKNTWVHFNFSDSNNVKWEIVLDQRQGGNVNPVYLYNLKSATYNRHEYSSPGDIH